MNEEKLIITFDGQGNLDIETAGIKGQGCEKVVDEILVGIGGKAVDTRRTREFYEDDGDDPVKVLTEA